MSGMRSLGVRTHAWRLKEPFAIARGVREVARVVIVEIRKDGHAGRGEAGGVAYHGETPESMRQTHSMTHHLWILQAYGS